MLKENKAIFCLIDFVFAYALNIFFNCPNSQYNYKMLIRIFHFFNRNITILIDHCYNENPTVVDYLT